MVSSNIKDNIIRFLKETVTSLAVQKKLGKGLDGRS